MNDKERWAEELSAYLDGESRDAAALEKLLAEQPGLARQHNDYARIGALLRSLPDPDVHPAFATRVVAHAIEAGPAPAPWVAWLKWLVPAAGLAAVVLGAVYLQQEEAVVEETPVIAVLRKDWADEEKVVGQMEQMLDQGVQLELYADEDVIEPEAETAVEPVEPLSPEWREEIAREVYAYVSDPYWSTTEEEPLWFAPDYEDEYEALSNPERAVFLDLLRTYQENV